MYWLKEHILTHEEKSTLNKLSFSGGSSWVDDIINKDIDIDTPDKAGWTALIKCSYFGLKKLVEYLLSIGADPTVKDREGGSALTYAGNEEIREMLRTRIQQIETERENKYAKENSYFFSE